LIWVVGMPAVLIVLSCIWGIAANLKLAVFDWENEVSVVKQSMSALVGGMAGMVVALVEILVMIVIPRTMTIAVKTGIFIALVAMSVYLYNKNNKVRLEEL